MESAREHGGNGSPVGVNWVSPKSSGSSGGRDMVRSAYVGRRSGREARHEEEGKGGAEVHTRERVRSNSIWAREIFGVEEGIIGEQAPWAAASPYMRICT